MKRLFYLIAVAGIVMASCAKPNEGPNRTKTYPISVSAQQTADGTDGTRIENIDGIDHWSVGDKIGIYIFSEGTADDVIGIQYGDNYAGDLYVHYPGTDFVSGAVSFIDSDAFSRAVISNFAMTGMHTEPTQTTNFEGALSYDQISQLDPNSKYDYIAYYPYINTSDPTLMLLSLLVPENEITVRSNVFPGHTARLFGTAHINSSPMTWLDENEEQQWGERKVFNYGHTMSYLRLKLTGNRINPDVPVVCVSINTVTIIPSVNAQSGEAEAGISGLLKVYIEDGMNVGDYIYIPITPLLDVSNTNMDFEFTFEDDTTWSTTIVGGKTEMGKVHPVSIYIQ